jgi:DNA-binding protein HU-beta
MAAKRMTQSQIVRALAEKCEVSNKVSRQLVDNLSETALHEVKKNGLFVIPGLGRLVRVDRKARIGRNPATGETINIRAEGYSRRAVPPFLTNPDRIRLRNARGIREGLRPGCRCRTSGIRRGSHLPEGSECQRSG